MKDKIYKIGNDSAQIEEIIDKKLICELDSKILEEHFNKDKLICGDSSQQSDMNRLYFSYNLDTYIFYRNKTINENTLYDYFHNYKEQINF